MNTRNQTRKILSVLLLGENDKKKGQSQEALCEEQDSTREEAFGKKKYLLTSSRGIEVSKCFL